jgi:hypothetical protein
MAKDLPFDLRVVEQFAKATVKNIVDGIVELVTNCDDSYRRLEGKSQNTSGKIEIFINRKKGGDCNLLIVKDYAEGMTKEKLEKAIVFGGETSGFEEGKSVRGLFGRGLKETIIALGEAEIKTIKNGKLCKTRVWLDKKKRKPQYDDELMEHLEDTTDPNSTEIIIRITNEKMKIPEFTNFKQQIENHYALRDINSSQHRVVSLNFHDIKRDTKRISRIKFVYPEGRKIYEKNDSPLTQFGDKITVLIYECLEPLDSPRNNPFGLAGILVKTKGAILDNRLFKFENHDAARYFYGLVLCEGLEERLRNGETELIDPNRGGLEWRHEYCQNLSYEIENILEPLVQRKIKELEKKPEKEVQEETRKLVQRLCSKLNQLANKELEEFEIPEPDPDISKLVIKPEVANIHLEIPRSFSIYAPADIVNDSEPLFFIKSSDISVIQPLASRIILQRHPKYQNIWYRYFMVVGKKEGAEGTITVYKGEEKAEATIKVAPPGTRKKGEIHGKKGGFISDIQPDELDNPPQRVVYRDGVIRIYVRFPSTVRFITSGLVGVEKAEGRMLLAELVGDSFCKELARKGIEGGKYPKIPGGEIDSFNTALNELQKKYLHEIQQIIFAWKFEF